MNRWRRLLLWTACLLASPWATAQPYPNKPVRMVVGYTPGGAADVIARVLAEAMGRHLGQTVQVENRPGAGSTLGTDLVVRAPADGYTLLLGTATVYGIDQHLYKARYGHNSFAPISLVATSPLILAVNKNLGVGSVAELLSYARANPGKLNYAHSGIGGTPQLAGIGFEKAAGVPMTHVPFKGGAPALQAVVAGDVHLSFGTAASVLPLGRQGQVRMLGVSSPGKSAVAPELPALAEQGLPGFDYGFWFGLFAPAGTPAEVVDRLFTATTRALAEPEVRAKLLAGGNEAAPSASPADFARWAQDQGRQSLERVVAAGVKIE